MQGAGTPRRGRARMDVKTRACCVIYRARERMSAFARPGPDPGVISRGRPSRMQRSRYERSEPGHKLPLRTKPSRLDVIEYVLKGQAVGAGKFLWAHAIT